MNLFILLVVPCLSFFFFNDTATTEIYTLSLHDALPICGGVRGGARPLGRAAAHDVRGGDAHRAAPRDRSREPPRARRRGPGRARAGPREIGRAHGWTPITRLSPMSASAFKKKKTTTKLN